MEKQTNAQIKTTNKRINKQTINKQQTKLYSISAEKIKKLKTKLG